MLDPTRFFFVGKQWQRSPGKSGSHFNPYSDMFTPNERHYIVTSTLCWALMVANLAFLSIIIGPTLLFNLYGIPYLVCLFFFDLGVLLSFYQWSNALSSTDIRYVVGFRYLFASPWPWAKTSLVSWQGKDQVNWTCIYWIHWSIYTDPSVYIVYCIYTDWSVYMYIIVYCIYIGYIDGSVFIVYILIDQRSYHWLWHISLHWWVVFMISKGMELSEGRINNRWSRLWNI